MPYTNESSPRSIEACDVVEGFGGAAQPSMAFVLALSLLLTKGEASV